MIWIRNCEKIAVYGIGSTANPTGESIFMVEDSKDVALAAIFSESWEVFWNLPEQKEKPIITVRLPDGRELTPPVHDRPTLWRT